MSSQVIDTAPTLSGEDDVVLDLGVIRNGQALITLYAREAVSSDLQLVAVGADGSAVATWRLRPPSAEPPATAEPEAEPNPYVEAGLLRMKARSRLTPEHGPVRRFELRSSQGPIRIQRSDRFQLDELFYPTPEEFSRSQIARRKCNRPLDKETQMFMTAQMAVAYADISSGGMEIAMTMTASYAYRATDLLRRDHAQRAVELLDALIGQIEQLPPSDYNENAIVSLLTARWHACAALEDMTGFQRSLTAIFDRTASICANTLVFTLCYNTVRSLCVLAGHSLVRGDTARAEACFEAIGDILRAGGSRLTLNVAHLREYSSTCRVAGPIGYFRNEIQRAEAEGVPVQQLHMSSLRGTVAEKAREHLIRPGIRSDRSDRLTEIIGTF
ncbi:hypothetical protein SAMN02745194_03081 [Roseomonas rosea]|uniref:Uncharacterized protein n=1 Tax=Muricoccus roseus TaxID=198092 RepID=A0A1M6L8F9_9PROT|nr:hypothetical protein [Roseomonas rosea]SHJ67424.1 hypothetical protein SAMN02745194_03081 [Roseomonas rosea]